MRSLPKPQHKVEDILISCIGKIKNEDLKLRLTNSKDSLVNAVSEYESRVTNNELYLLPRIKSINGNVSSEEMIKLYVDRMAKLGHPARLFYDELMAVPKNGKCPFCGHRIVSTIDHYLPKAHYPIYSIAPVNLIPCCKDCNKIKNSTTAESIDDQPLHPYYDDFNSDIWLKAKIISSKFIIDFYIDPPEKWSPTTFKRLEYHFSTLELSKLFASVSANEIVSIKYALNKIHSTSGMIAVQEHLADQAESRIEAYLNCWESALYTCLAQSEWFCDGGFEEW